MQKKIAGVILNLFTVVAAFDSLVPTCVQAQQSEVFGTQTDHRVSCNDAQAEEEQRYKGQMLEINKEQIEVNKEYVDQLLMCKRDNGECARAVAEERYEKLKKIGVEQNDANADHQKKTLEIAYRCAYAGKKQPSSQGTSPQPEPQAEQPQSGPTGDLLQGYATNNQGVITEIGSPQPGHVLSADLSGAYGFKGVWNIPDSVISALTGRDRVSVDAAMSNYRNGSMDGRARGYFYRDSAGRLHFNGTIFSTVRSGNGESVVKPVSQGDIPFDPWRRKIDENGTVIYTYD